ncbi:enterochelin esterase domain-containing protein [Actinophytocola sp.]|jgi:enterochelin esterase family protein|uniref:enterochelin esterase domain-containing protein n=1 Tax=Actinophytocola sp. TaxID=1872138 RepID=UPI002EDA54ED
MTGTLPTAWRTVVPGNRIAAASGTFRADIERNGTPLVALAPGDAVDVTFLLRAAPDSGPWTLTDGISPGANPEFALTNVPGTDVWHVTLRLPRDTRVTYTFTRDPRFGAANRTSTSPRTSPHTWSIRTTRAR